MKKPFLKLQTILPLANSLALILSSVAITAILITPRIGRNVAGISKNEQPILITVDVPNISIEKIQDFYKRLGLENEVRLSIRNQNTKPLNIIGINNINLNDFGESDQVSNNSASTNNNPHTTFIRFKLEGIGLRGSNGYYVSGKNLKIGSSIIIEGSIFRFPGLISNIVFK